MDAFFSLPIYLKKKKKTRFSRVPEKQLPIWRDFSAHFKGKLS